MQSTEKYLARFATIENPKRRTFSAMLSAMDDNVGQVLAKIRELRAQVVSPPAWREKGADQINPEA